VGARGRAAGGSALQKGYAGPAEWRRAVARKEDGILDRRACTDEIVRVVEDSPEDALENHHLILAFHMHKLIASPSWVPRHRARISGRQAWRSRRRPSRGMSSESSLKQKTCLINRRRCAHINIRLRQRVYTMISPDRWRQRATRGFPCGCMRRLFGALWRSRMFI
jgi:hypothetical protein